jgi:hypothetical protein
MADLAVAEVVLAEALVAEADLVDLVAEALEEVVLVEVGNPDVNLFFQTSLIRVIFIFNTI